MTTATRHYIVTHTASGQRLHNAQHHIGALGQRHEYAGADRLAIAIDHPDQDLVNLFRLLAADAEAMGAPLSEAEVCARGWALIEALLPTDFVGAVGAEILGHGHSGARASEPARARGAVGVGAISQAVRVVVGAVSAADL